MIWTIPNIKVIKVFEHKVQSWVGGTGPEAVFKEKSLGFFAQIEGSYESLFLGKELPDLQSSDLVDLTITRHKRTST